MGTGARTQDHRQPHRQPYVGMAPTVLASIPMRAALARIIGAYPVTANFEAGRDPLTAVPGAAEGSRLGAAGPEKFAHWAVRVALR